MNERIKQLMIQADYPAPEIAKRAQKLAELIIQECLLALEPDLYESGIEYRVDQAFYKKCERIIKKHFGVEE